MARKDIIAELVAEARTDAKVSAFLDRDLEQIEAEIYKVEYPELAWRRFIPVDNQINPGVESISYKVYDVFGVAKFIASYADDLPNVTVRGEKFTSHVEGIGQSYSFSTQDLRASAMSGFPLDREEAIAAAEFVERLMDKTAAFGNKKLGMLGFLNNPNVPIDAAPNNAGATSTKWINKTPDEVLKDLHALPQAQVTATKLLHAPDQMILPPSLYGYAATTRASTLTENTILQVFLKNNPYIKSVDQWLHLETASETGAPRVMCYKKIPRVCQAKVPLELLQHEPQRKNLAFVVPMEARFGGVISKIPLGMRYLDGAG